MYDSFFISYSIYIRRSSYHTPSVRYTETEGEPLYLHRDTITNST